VEAMQEIANSKGRKQKGTVKGALKEEVTRWKVSWFLQGTEGTTVLLGEILFDTYNIIIIIIS